MCSEFRGRVYQSSGSRWGWEILDGSETVLRMEGYDSAEEALRECESLLAGARPDVAHEPSMP